MANNVTNIIELRGKPERVQELLNAIGNDEYGSGSIRANCEYPGEWDGAVEQIIMSDTHIVTATHVFSKDGSISCHATSFIRVVDGKITAIDEYWGDDGPAPQWRQNKHIGTEIR